MGTSKNRRYCSDAEDTAVLSRDSWPGSQRALDLKPHAAGASPVSLPLGKVGPLQPLVPRCLELPLGLIEAVDVASVHLDLVRIERCADTKCPEPALARTFLADRANLPIAGDHHILLEAGGQSGLRAA